MIRVLTAPHDQSMPLIAGGGDGGMRDAKSRGMHILHRLALLGILFTACAQDSVDPTPTPTGEADASLQSCADLPPDSACPEALDACPTTWDCESSCNQFCGLSCDRCVDGLVQRVDIDCSCP